MKGTLRERTETRVVVADRSIRRRLDLMPSQGEEVTLSGCQMTEQHPVCTCEDVLAQSRRTTIFAIVEVL